MRGRRQAPDGRSVNANDPSASAVVLREEEDAPPTRVETTSSPRVGETPRRETAQAGRQRPRRPVEDQRENATTPRIERWIRAVVREVPVEAKVRENVDPDAR